MIPVLRVVKIIGLASALGAQCYFALILWILFNGLTIPIGIETRPYVAGPELGISVIGILVLVWEVAKLLPEKTQ